jgi:aldehyde dehydrogenase (NAD+)
LAILPASSKVIKEPLGSALIIAPWNYPVQLLLNPLVGAISSGCTAMLKPSPYVPHVSAVLTEMIRATFPEEYIAIVEGNRQVNQALLAERWDLIFFTGSPDLGRLVMSAAAKNLTPVVLELGGKSPCIIDKNANLKVAAKRVAWGKVLNAGQTCIAPDYLYIHEEVKDKFLSYLVKEWKELLTKQPQKATHFARIVNDKALERLVGYLADGTIYHGGEYDKAERYLAPTILTDVRVDSAVMTEEIFGPIFPVITFKEIEEVIRFVTEREKPLALYYFGTKGDYVLRQTSSGGACVNDVIMHIVNHSTPFGGVGNSGMSAYHGKDSFLAFSHRRTVISTPTWVDMPFRYMPYKLFKFIKKMV